MASWESSSASPVGPASTSATSRSWDESQSVHHPGMHNVASDMDFALVWPDSENLFQSLMSSDTTDQWQMPLGTLPFPPVVQDINGMNFGSPNSFDDRSSSIGAIPSGGGHQAVRDVTDMINSSVGTLAPLSGNKIQASVVVIPIKKGSANDHPSPQALLLPSKPRPSHPSF